MVSGFNRSNEVAQELAEKIKLNCIKHYSKTKSLSITNSWRSFWFCCIAKAFSSVNLDIKDHAWRIKMYNKLPHVKKYNNASTSYQKQQEYYQMNLKQHK